MLFIHLREICISFSWNYYDLVLCCAVLVAQLCLTLCDPMDYNQPGSFVHGDSPGKNTGMGCHALLQGIFPTQGLNPGLPHCRQTLYHLSYQGIPQPSTNPAPSAKDAGRSFYKVNIHSRDAGPPQVLAGRREGNNFVQRKWFLKKLQKTFFSLEGTGTFL